jgi:hypothetical protein
MKSAICFGVRQSATGYVAAELAFPQEDLFSWVRFTMPDGDTIGRQ